MFTTNQELFCQVPNINKKVNFNDYRVPNEGTPINVKPHLDLMEEGWIVSTGTERSFFDLLLSPDDECKGLIIRDINPKVKAYCDFLVLLLCCAKNREHFCYLSDDERVNDTKFKNEIFELLDEVVMSQTKKNYFKENFDLLASCYFGCIHMPINGSNEGVNYRSEDHLFKKLKKYALLGKIIPTVGDINDLGCFEGRKITVIDTSNISDYVSIKPKNYGDSVPRIIFTAQHYFRTKYFSALYEKIDEKQFEKIEKYMSLFKSSSCIDNFLRTYGLVDDDDQDIFNWTHVSCYTLENILKISKALVKLKNFGYRNFFVNSFKDEETYKAFLKIMSGQEPETEIEIIFDDLINESTKKEKSDNMYVAQQYGTFFHSPSVQPDILIKNVNDNKL